MNGMMDKGQGLYSRANLAMMRVKKDMQELVNQRLSCSCGSGSCPQSAIMPCRMMPSSQSTAQPASRMNDGSAPATTSRGVTMAFQSSQPGSWL